MKPGAQPKFPERPKEDIYKEIDAIVDNPASGEAALDPYRDDLPGYNQWKQKQQPAPPVLFSKQLPPPRTGDIPASPAMSPGKFNALTEQAERKASEKEAAREKKKKCCCFW